MNQRSSLDFDRLKQFNNLGNTSYLNSTSRQFYTRRKPEVFSNTNPNLTKIFKLLSQSSNIMNFQTKQLKKRYHTQKFYQSQNSLVIQMLKQKIIVVLKKLPNQFKQLFHRYEKVVTSQSQSSFEENNICFMEKYLQHCSLKYKSQNHQNSKIRISNIKKANSNNHQNLFKVENLKLQKQYEQIQSQLRDFRQKAKFSSKLSLELYDPLGKIDNNFIHDNQQLLATEIQQFQQEIYLLKQQKTILADKLQDLKTTNQNLCSEIINLKYLQQKSGSCMEQKRNHIELQRQQILSYEREMAQLRKTHFELNRKYLILLKRLKASNKENDLKAPQVNQAYLNFFNEQLDAFTKIRSIPLSSFVKPNYEKQKQKDPKLFTYRTFLSEKQTLSNTEGIRRIPRQLLTLVKPSFYCFVETNLSARGIDQINFQHVSIESMTHRDFVSTLRAILDSKFNETFNQSAKPFYSFPIFVYCWLASFTIEKTKKNLKFKNDDINVELISNFYIKLMDKNYNHNWQIVTFRQFLLETLSIDQLNFYLNARFFLFKGSILNNHSFYFEDICYVPYFQVSDILQKFVGDLSYRKQLQQFIRRSIIFVKKKPFIDSHYVLRMLLEYYRMHKTNQIDSLNSICQIVTQKNASNIQFDSFLRIFDYQFAETTLSQRLNLYFKCFSLGNSVISNQILITVLIEQGYFCLLNPKKFPCEPITKQINLLQSQLQSSNSPNEFLCQHQYFFKRVLNQYSTQIDKLGLFEINNQRMKIQKLNEFTVFARYQFLVKVCLIILKKQFYSKKIPIQKVKDYFAEMKKTVNCLIKTSIRKEEIWQLQKTLSMQSACSKIFRFYSKKRAQKILKYGIKNQESNQKAQHIRKQFMDLINNMKKKNVSLSQI